MKPHRTRPAPRVNARQPAWVLFALGCLFASITLDVRRPQAAQEDGPPPLPLDPMTAPARELRRLPGIGPARAAAIAEYRWEQGGAPFALREVAGIGEATERRVLEWLEGQK